MVQESHPFDGRDWQESEFARWAMQLQITGVAGTPGSSALRVTPGVGLQSIVEPGQAIVQGHYYRNTANLPLVHAPNPSGQTRLDYVVLDLDPAANSIGASVVAGTPGLGAPDLLIQNTAGEGRYQEPLSLVTVAPSATTVTVQPVTRYLGTRVRPCLSTQRPGTPAPGTPIFETDTGRLRVWNGSAWILHRSEFEPQPMLRARTSRVTSHIGAAGGQEWSAMPLDLVSEVFGDGAAAFGVSGQGIQIRRNMVVQAVVNASLNMGPGGSGVMRIVRYRAALAKYVEIGRADNAGQGFMFTTRPETVQAGDFLALQAFVSGPTVYSTYGDNEDPDAPAAARPTPFNVTAMELSRVP